MEECISCTHPCSCDYTDEFGDVLCRQCMREAGGAVYFRGASRDDDDAEEAPRLDPAPWSYR